MKKDLEGAKLLNELVDLVRMKNGDYAPEALAGLLSTVVTNDQLQALVNHLTEQLDDYEINIPTGRSLHTAGE